MNDLLSTPAAARESIALPAAPQRHTRGDFPWMASVAPVVMAVAIWAITQSPFALMFAFLGPVVAIASTMDGARQARKRARAERQRFRSQLERCRAEIVQAHERERRCVHATPAHHLVARARRDPDWWRQHHDRPIWIAVGSGSVPSRLSISGGLGGERENYPDLAALEDSVREQARTLDDAIVEIDAREFIGIAASGVVADSIARAILAQLMIRLSPRSTQILSSGSPSAAWLTAAPHPRSDLPDEANKSVWFVPGVDAAHVHSVGHGHGDDGVLCDVSDCEQHLSRRCRVTITVDNCGVARISGPGLAGPVSNFRPHFLGEVDAWGLARRATVSAHAEGLLDHDAALPRHIGWADLNNSEVIPSRGELIAHFAADSAAPHPIDLVADGPHAIVGGTTGTGKSELLISWVLSLAHTYPPEQVTFLLADFKGGSSFAALGQLPHVVGIITDLDTHVAVRAIESLRAEVRLREALLAECGVRHIDELAPPNTLPRLVIVVDEFAVVMNDFPELAALFEDVAARGRSLGIHLILCTQRPAGVVRDTIAANCTLRLSLRVNNPADSISVVGVRDAAELPKDPPGRCVVSSGEQPKTVQIALSTGADSATVTMRNIAARSATAEKVRRPWCDPLPDIITSIPAAARGQITLGIADHPETQNQPAARYDPAVDGNLLIIGSHHSGKSTLLHTIQRSAIASTCYRVVRIGDDLEHAWDQVTSALTSTADTLYLIDDLDAVIARFESDHELEFRRSLTQLLREGTQRNIHTVAAVRHLNSAVHTLSTQFASTIVLHTTTRNDHVLAGGESAHYRKTRISGRGWWKQHEMQAVLTSPPTEDPTELAGTRQPVDATLNAIAHAGGALIISPHSAALAQAILERMPTATVAPIGESDLLLTGGAATGLQLICGTPSLWQEQWNRLPALLTRYPAWVEGCTLAEYRALMGTRVLPPPLNGALQAAWLHHPDGSVQRIQTPEPADRASEV